MKVRGWLPLPLPSRTVRADFPHTALHRNSPSGQEQTTEYTPGMPRTSSPIQPLFSLAHTPRVFREDTALPLVHDPFERGSRVSSIGSSPIVNVGGSGSRGLAHRSMPLPFRLRSLGCSRLSSGVVATMNRSDSSVAPRRTALPVSPRFQPRLSACSGAAEVSLGHARLYSTHPDANHVTGSCAGLHPLGQAGPPVPSNRVHFRFGLGFGSDPSPTSSRRQAVFAYWGYNLCTGPPAGFEPARYVRCEAHQSPPARTECVSRRRPTLCSCQTRFQPPVRSLAYVG